MMNTAYPQSYGHGHGHGQSSSTTATTTSSRRGVRNANTSSSSSSLASTILLLSVGMASFFAGTLYTMHLGINNCQQPPGSGLLHSHTTPQEVEQLAQKRLRELQAALPKCQPNNNHGRDDSHHHEESSSSSSSPLVFPPTMDRYLVGASRTSKVDFFDQLDLGVPMDIPNQGGGGDSDVLILYQRIEALPKRYHDFSETIPSFDHEINGAKEALEHCDYVNVILTDHGKARNQCWAMVPQYESYHIQKWMRIPEQRPAGTKYNDNIVDHSYPLRLVGRGIKSNGHTDFESPEIKDMRRNWDLLLNYFQAFEDVIKELKPLVQKVATPKKTVTVMVSNFGQSELLVNFVCAAKSRGLDTSSILVFATDMETKALADHLGLTAFYDERNFGAMPRQAAGHYGDRFFTAMMMAKVYCVHMVSSLKYNILFQDVDIVWYKDPIPFFETQHLDFDLIFQDDGGHTVRYAPYSANSGFYYVRYNERTEYLFNSLLLAGDLIQKTDSHQQALIALLSEHNSLFGLKPKVLSRDEPDFPGGYHYHQKTGKYMRELFAGKVHPYIFHMSWTQNKDNKLLFLKQMGEWYVQEKCIHKSVPDILGSSATTTDEAKFVSTCCAAEPLISCHYRDKPSKFPCKDSPPIDAGKPSFWK